MSDVRDSLEIEFLGYDCGLGPVAKTNLHREVAELARHVQAEIRPHYESVAQRFAALAPDHVPGVAAAGALLTVGRGEQRPVSDAATTAGQIEQLHLDLGEGPAIAAAADQQTVRLPDIRGDSRWPRFTAALAGMPARELLCVPLFTHLHSWGALIVLAESADPLDADAEQAAEILATHAALTLDVLHHDRHYRSALGSRDIIGQAKGVLIERFDIDATGAFALLTKLAEESHRPVVVVAKELLERKLAVKV